MLSKKQPKPLTNFQKILCHISLQTFFISGTFSLIAGLLFLSQQFNKLDLILKPICRALKKLKMDVEPLEKLSANITRNLGQGFTTRGSIILFGILAFMFLLSCYTGYECYKFLQDDANAKKPELTASTPDLQTADKILQDDNKKDDVTDPTSVSQTIDTKVETPQVTSNIETDLGLG